MYHYEYGHNILHARRRMRPTQKAIAPLIWQNVFGDSTQYTRESTPKY